MSAVHRGHETLVAGWCDEMGMGAMDGRVCSVSDMRPEPGQPCGHPLITQAQLDRVKPGHTIICLDCGQHVRPPDDYAGRSRGAGAAWASLTEMAR